MKERKMHTVKDFTKEIFDKYYVQIYNYILSRTGYNKELAEDITQEVFIKIWQKQESFDPEKASLKTWIFKIARNTLIDYYRKRKLEQVSPENIQLTDTSIDLEKEIEIDEQVDKIHRVLNRLKPKYRELLVLRYINELDIEEIAEIIGKSKQTTKVSIFRAKQKLLKEMAKDE